MASRDTQGLQIAVIFFAVLTILGVVVSYMFFSRYKEQVAKTEAANTQAAKANSDLAAANKDKGDLLALIGAQPTDQVPDVISAETAKINQYAPHAPTLDKAMLSMRDTINSVNKNLADTQRARADDKAAFDQNLAKAQADAKQYSDAREQAENNLNAERTKYNDAVSQLDATKTELTNSKAALNAQLEKTKADYQAQISAGDLRYKQVVAENADMKHLIDSYSHPNPQVSGGHIVLVNEAENSVYLDLGSDDGLNRKTTFNVYPRGTVNVTNIPAKGQIEVTNVSGPHTSEARIVNNPINNPLLPGDLVHSIEWAPGQHPHYAIDGIVDLTGNGKDQTQKLIEMINASGGIVDAYLEDFTDSDGKLSARVRGKITFNTRYLINGSQNASTAEGLARLGPSQALDKEAVENHVEQIGLDKFLDMMGYVAPRDVEPGAVGVRPNPTAKGVQSGSFQNSFRPRQPGAIQDADSATAR